MWDIYNEPGQFGIGEKAITLLELVWKWALEVRPSQPLTAVNGWEGLTSSAHFQTSSSKVIAFSPMPN